MQEDDLDHEGRQETSFTSPDPYARANRADHYDAKDPDTKFPPIEQLRPPKGAPNVLLILIDDAGFCRFLNRTFAV